MNCIWGNCIDSKCLCFDGVIGEACDSILPKEKKKSDFCNDFIGINIGGIADWSTELPFIDMMKTSREWIFEYPWGGWSSAENIKNTVTFTKYNYPITLPHNINLVALMARDLDSHYDQGIYTVLYDGDGTLTFSMDVNNQNIKRFIGKILIEVNPSTQFNNGIVLKIERSNPDNPIRNIRVIRPGFEKIYKKLIFHPLFLSQIKPFNAIRFMDFFATNSQKDENWENRTLESFRTYSLNGVPIETMINLSNLTGKNMWINIPHKANDIYIENLALLVIKKLRPDLKVYVEFSNEVWGNLFPGGKYAQEQGLLKGFSLDSVQARFCYLGYITKKISLIFRKIFYNINIQSDFDFSNKNLNNKDNINRDRLKIVISTQAVNADTTRRILECQNAFEYVDAVAIAPYFNVELKDEYNEDTVFNSLLDQKFEEIEKLLQSHLFFTKKYNLEFYNYESGQGFTGNNQAQTNLQIKLQTDARMKTAYQKYLEILKKNQVNLTMLFSSVGNWSKYGSWGILRYQDSKPFDSKKFSGVLDFLNNLNSFENYKKIIAKNSDSSNTIKNSNYNFDTSNENLKANLISDFCKFSEKDFSNCDLDPKLSKNVCNNMGICYANSCFCYENAKGKNCHEIKYIDYIDCGYKCNFNNGICVLKNTLENKNFYGCNCNEGYKGNECGIPICESECSYNGICIKAGVCECFQGRKGKNCEIDCGCDGHGICNINNNECLCDSGFEFNLELKKCVPLCFDKINNLKINPNCAAPYDSKCTPDCIWGKCSDGKCFCYPGFYGDYCENEVNSNLIINNNPNSKINANYNQKLNFPLGINISGLSYWSSQFLFKNYFYQSSEFIPQYYPGFFNNTIQYTWNTSEDIPKTRTGYPSELKDYQKISKLLFRDLKLKIPKDNNFVLLYEGEGIINLGFDAKINSRRAGRIEFNITASLVRDNGIYLEILKTNPKNPIKNIRIINTKDEYNYEKDFITESFTEFIKHFSTIRFMDLQHTNGNSLEKPEDENLLDSDTQANQKGLNTQLMIKLAVVSGTNPWICIPYKATDKYVKFIAEKFKKDLPKNLKIYVEYSNEVWNEFFSQGKYAKSQAKILGLENSHKFYAKRSLEIFEIFEDVFKDEKNRLRFVISTQLVNGWVTEQILSYKNLKEKANILAVGVYYDCNGIGNKLNSALTALKKIEEILSICEENMNLNSLDKNLQMQVNLAKANNLEITAYECGTSISEDETIYNGFETPSLTEKLVEVNRHKRMKGIFKRFLYKLLQFGIIGKTPAMIFSSIGLPSKYGSWGLLEYSEQIYENSSHPKFEAIKEFTVEWLNNNRNSK